MAVSKSKKIKKTFFLILIIIILLFLGWKETDKQPEIEKEQEEEFSEEKTIEDIVKQVARFDNYDYYVQDLNEDGYSEVFIISLNQYKNVAYFALISLVSSNNFIKRGETILEDNFFDLPVLEKTQDIKGNNIKEIIIDLNAGGVAVRKHALLQWNQDFDFVFLETKEGEKEEAIFLTGSSARHYQVYYLKEKEIIEISVFEKECQVFAYELKDNIFAYNQNLSDYYFNQAQPDCLLDI